MSSRTSLLQEAEHRFQGFLADRGLRLTRERRRLLELVFRGNGRLEAESLAERARRLSRPISRATVYRTLDLMVKCGLLRPSRTNPGAAVYEPALSGARTVRLVCLTCGKLSEVASHAFDRERDELCRRLGFLPRHHHLEVFGLCQVCRRAAEAPPARPRRRRSG